MSSSVLPGEWSPRTSQETVFNPDYRTPVPEDEYKDGGAFRSIVKLRICYNNQVAAGHYLGTGWLIAPDVLVTAGHNVYSHDACKSKILGHAIRIECYIGYHGCHSIEEGIQDHSVQRREAKYIITTPQWLDSSNNRHHDVAFIKVDRPFVGNLRQFTYMPTPRMVSGMIGVVGYPHDREAGETMYQEFINISNNLNDPNDPLPMLRYRISTNPGQSGSPVILSGGSGGQVVIATHVYGCDTLDLTDENKGSLIGPLWNDYDAYHSVLANQGPTDKEGIQFLYLPPPGGAAESAKDPDGFVDITSNPTKPSQTEESFTKVGCQIGKLALGFATKPSCLGKVLHDCSSSAGLSSDNPKELLEKAVVQMGKSAVMGITQGNAMQLSIESSA